MSNPNGKPRVYSYIRFSTPEQSMGDSERRQLEDARAWAKRNSRELDEKSMIDRGLSGYHGDHRTKGALRGFLDLVKAGAIPAGSILLVENVDRLSREGAAKTLREIIFNLWDHGITLQTLNPEEPYPPGCDGDPKFIALFMYMQRAQDESKRKSERIRAAREQARKKAREEKRILTRRCPAWLTVSKEGRFEPIPTAVDTIRQIFALKLQGIGTRTIEGKLNEAAAWKPPKRKNQRGEGWRASYIKKILRTPAVTGEYQPHQRTTGKRLPSGDPIADYYPRIIEPALFHAVQEKMKANRGKGGCGKGERLDKAKNLLRHLARCGYCGGPMRFMDKSDRYLCCDNGCRRVKCKRYSVRYEECEKLLLENCHELRPEQVLPNPDEQAKLCYSLRQRIDGSQAELQSLESQVENLIDQIARTPDQGIRDRYEAKIGTLTERKKAVEAELGTEERELHKAQAAMQSFTNWKRNLVTLKRELKKGGIEVRMRLQAHLRELIDYVEVFAVGSKGKVYRPYVLDQTPGSGEGIYWFDSQGEHRMPPSRAEPFIDFVNNRLATKEGRFLRVHFKSLAVPGDDHVAVDLVPDGSLADGLILSRPADDVLDAWDVVRPGFGRLWKEFQEKVKSDTIC